MAAHVTNFLQTNEQILLDLINADNSTSLPSSAVTFGAPAEVTPGAVETTVTVTAASGSGYRGDQTFSYSRVPLSFMTTNEPTLVIESAETTIHALIPFLNDTFGIQLTTADIVDGPIEELQPDVDGSVTLTATATSLVWHGSVELPITLPLVDIATLLTVTTLDGLYPPVKA